MESKCIVHYFLTPRVIGKGDYEVIREFVIRSGGASRLVGLWKRREVQICENGNGEHMNELDPKLGVCFILFPGP